MLILYRIVLRLSYRCIMLLVLSFLYTVSLSTMTQVDAARLPHSSRSDCPSVITRHLGKAYFAATITVHAGGPTCISRLPDGIILTVGGGTAPQIPHQGRSVFRISGAGIDYPGGINIIVSASPVGGTVPELLPLHEDAIVQLPRGAVLRRYDPASNTFIPIPSGHLRQWALYKVIRNNVPLTVPSVPPPEPTVLPATGSALLTHLNDALRELGELGGEILLIGSTIRGKAWKTRRRRIALVAVCIGGPALLVAGGVIGLHLYDQAAAPTGFGTLVGQGPHVSAMVASGPPTSLVIARLGIDTPVIPLDSTSGAWQLPSYSAGYLQEGTWPGQNGNFAVTAHDDRDGNVFQHLDAVHYGDVVQLHVGVHIYRYTVVALHSVPPTDTQVLRPTRGATLTLVTCTPFLVDTERLIVRGQLAP